MPNSPAQVFFKCPITNKEYTFSKSEDQEIWKVIEDGEESTLSLSDFVFYIPVQEQRGGGEEVDSSPSFLRVFRKKMMKEERH